MAADGGTGGRARARPETPAEARTRRGEIEDPESVLAAAARLLESRHRTVHEVRRRLTEAGYRATLVEGAVTRLADLGYLDDEEFARAWVASRDRAHPRGERALRLELARKGVGREIIDEVLGERAAEATSRMTGTEGDAVDPETAAIAAGEEGGAAPRGADETAAARLLERRRAALERVEDPRERRRRAYALLARAGFDPETAATVAERFVRAEPEG